MTSAKKKDSTLLSIRPGNRWISVRCFLPASSTERIARDAAALLANA